jgi:hypothetical protein
MSADPKGKPTPDAAADPAAAVAAFWTQWLEQSSRGTQALLEMMQSAGDPQQVLGAMQSAVDPQKVQRHWLDAVARSIDDFMRSPAFLEIMKQNLKSVTDLKGLQNQVAQGTASQLGVAQASDITGLFERLQSTEQTILNRLRAIEDRLKAIEAKH